MYNKTIIRINRGEIELNLSQTSFRMVLSHHVKYNCNIEHID